MFENRTVLVTGGTGSFGKAFINKLLCMSNTAKVIVFSRDELKQYEMQTQKPFDSENIRYFIGDVRDKERLKLAMNAGVHYVIHAAALKHVSAIEYNPFEAIKTNIIGAQNVIDVALEAKVEKLIALSTDKAAAPINLYGATKLASDKLFIAANNYSASSNTKFSVVRYGNVMGSRGSVIPFFLSRLREDAFPITDERMTRFSLTLDESVAFVMRSFERMWGGEIFVPKIPSYRLVDLARSISPTKKQEIIGKRPGEKLHEEMITPSDSFNTAEFENHFVIMPEFDYIGWSASEYLSKKNGSHCSENFSYNSVDNDTYLSVEELRRLIIDNVEGGGILENISK